MAANDRRLEGLGDAHHHQQIAVWQFCQARVESSQTEGFGVEVARQRRFRQVDIVGYKHQLIDFVAGL